MVVFILYFFVFNTFNLINNNSISGEGITERVNPLQIGSYCKCILAYKLLLQVTKKLFFKTSRKKNLQDCEVLKEIYP